MIAGAIVVDAPTVGCYGVPGLDGATSGSTIALQTNQLRLESFYVASDAIHVTSLAFFTTSGVATDMRVGLADSDGVVLADLLMSPPATGSNVGSVDVVLPRGTYYALLWSAGDAPVRGITGYRAEQGWDFYPDDTPFFISARSGTVDLSAGLSLDVATTDEQALTPGEVRTVVLAWDLP